MKALYRTALILTLLLCLPCFAGQTYSPAGGTYTSSADGLGMIPVNYYSNMLYDNLVAYNAGFQGIQRIMSVQADTGSSTTSFINQYKYDTIASNQAFNWTINVAAHYNSGGGITGGAYGCTGTITGNTVANPPTVGPTYTFNPPCSAPIGNSDIVTVTAPLSGLLPTANRWNVLYGSVALSQDTTPANLPPAAVVGLPQVYGVEQFNVTGGGGAIDTQIDTGGTANIIINGTTTEYVQANLISGSCTIAGTVLRNGSQPYISGSAQNVTSGWHTYTWTGSGLETATTSYTGVIQVEFVFSGNCVVDLIGANFKGGANSTTNGTLVPYTHTNASPFGDWVYNIYKRGGYDELRYNYASGNTSIIAGCSLYNLLQPVDYRQQCNVSQQNYVSDAGIPTGIDDLFKFAQAVGMHRVKIALPPTFTATDYTNLMRYIGAPCSDGYGQIRCNLGQNAAWTSVFTSIEFGWNETWNSVSTGQYLGGQPFVVAVGLAQVEATAIHNSPYWTPVVKVSVPMQQASASSNAGYLSAGGGTSIDLIDVSNYYNMATTTPTEPLMFQNSVAEAFASTTDSSLQQYQIGSAGVPISTYETAPGYVSGACTTTSCVGLAEGLGEGIVEALWPALMQYKWGPVFQHYDQFVLSNGPTTPYTSTGSPGATTIGLWSKLQNLRGAGAPANGSYYATTLYNTCSAMGTGYYVTGTGVPTFNSTAANAIPAESNVPLTYFRAYTDGTSNRCYLIYNVDSTSHTVNIGGAFQLAGTVTSTIYQSSNATPGLQDNNLMLNAAPVVSNSTSTAAASTSYTVPAYSILMLQGSVTSSRYAIF